MAHFEDCKFFLGGKCLNDHCAFRHNDVVLLSEQVCKRWAAGYVCDGRCNLRHPSVAELTAITTMPHKPQQQGTETQRELPGKGQKAPVCTFYLRGRCTRGSACGFSHETPADGTKKPPARESDESPAKVNGNGNGNGNGAPPVRKRGLDGKGSLGCVVDSASDSVSTAEAPTSAETTNAEQSIQAHERQGLISGPGRNAEARTCWFYSKGLCSKGSGCMFSHATQPVEDRAVAIVPPQRENKGTSTSTLRMAAVEARSAARKGVTDAQHAPDTSTRNRNEEVVKAKADAILRKHSLTKSRVTTDSVRDELKVPRGKRVYAKVIPPSSKDESPSKRQRMTEVNGREKDGVDGGTFPAAAKEDVSEEPRNDVSNRNGDTLSETWPRDPHVEGDGKVSLCPRSAQ